MLIKSPRQEHEFGQASVDTINYHWFSFNSILRKAWSPLKTHEAQLGRRDGYGQRYMIDFVLEWQDRSATIRSGWIMSMILMSQD
jgi:hypothetical protein